ncbi:MAG TPA: [LysW]-lysine hydrolase [Candidatus Thermoplasmatota archaeon]|nr:[LysW]-lysine hydrolase [Candidatus Thermoplasmatota archaeon]
MARPSSWLHPDVQLLHDLVAIPSVTGDTEKAAEWLVGEAKRRGLEAMVDEAGNAVVTAGRGERVILLVGHIDTVPGDLPVRLERGFLWGRGAVDAKGPLAAFVAAAARFKDREDVRLVVVGACDEEKESEGAKHLLPRYKPEALIIGEPSGVDGVTIGYKGIVKIRYELEDDLAHSGAPYPSVPDRGIAFWRSVNAYCGAFQGKGLFESASAKLGHFNTQMLPSGRVRIEMDGNVRTPPGFDAQSFIGHLTAVSDRGLLSIPEAVPAYVADKNSALCRAFIWGVRSQGYTAKYVKKTGTSDMNVLAPTWNVPCIAYGPGDSSLDHTPQERVSVEEYLASIDILEASLNRYLEDAGAV